MKMNEIIKVLRLSLGKTQAQLAEDLHITQHALSQYENGKRNVPNEILEELMEKAQVTITLTNKKEGKKMTLKEKYPNWTIQQEAVGIIMEGNVFSSKLEQNVLISIVEETAVVYKDIEAESGELKLVGGYFTTDEYLEEKSLDYGDQAYQDSIIPICEMTAEGEFVKTKMFNEIFGDDVFEDLVYISKNIGK